MEFQNVVCKLKAFWSRPQCIIEMITSQGSITRCNFLKYSTVHSSVMLFAMKTTVKSVIIIDNIFYDFWRGHLKYEVPSASTTQYAVLPGGLPSALSQCRVRMPSSALSNEQSSVQRHNAARTWWRPASTPSAAGALECNKPWWPINSWLPRPCWPHSSSAKTR